MGSTTDGTVQVEAEELVIYRDHIFEPDDWVEIRTLRVERGGSPRGRYFQAKDLASDEAISYLSNRNNGKLNLYLGPNPRRGNYGSGKGNASTDNDVLLARSVFLDFDDADPARALNRIRSARLPDPTMIVSSGRATGSHAYWRFRDPIEDLKLWRQIQIALIRATQSDQSIKNASRIMRIPGTMNFNHTSEGALCYVIKSESRDVLESWHELGVSPAEEFQSFDSGSGDNSDRRKIELLNNLTRNFLDSPCDEGSRNQTLFAAACEYKANGFTFDEAIDELAMKRAVQRDGLPESEARRTVANAYAREVDASISSIQYIEDPMKLVESVNEIKPFNAGAAQSSLDFPEDVPADSPSHGANKAETDGPTDDPIPADAQPRAADIDDRPMVSNVSIRMGQTQTGKREIVTLHRSLDEIRDDAKLVGWPREAKSIGLFYTSYDKDGNEILHPINRVSEVFSMFHSRAQVSWHSGTVPNEAGSILSTITKEEFVDSLRIDPLHSYDSVGEYPHEPPFPDYYYLNRNLPPATGEALRKFLDALNPETEEDRALMLAAMLTPGWGGPPGTRPLFVFSSDWGQGSGKTETAKAIASIWGGAPFLSTQDSWESVMKGLFSSSDWNARVAIFDNVRGRFGGADIESAITSPKLQGWKSYVGQVSRKNDITFFLTYNLPEMSRDLAERSIIIKVGKPRPGRFVQWVSEFVSEHKWALIADLLAILRAPPKCEMPVQGDRWGAWRDSVLARAVESNAEGIASLIESRRPGADEDEDDAEEIAGAISQYVMKNRSDEIKKGEIEITAKEIEIQMVANSLFTPDDTKSKAWNRKKCMSRVRSKMLGRSYLEPVNSPGNDGKQKQVYTNDLGRPVANRGQGGTRSKLFRFRLPEHGTDSEL